MAGKAMINMGNRLADKTHLMVCQVVTKIEVNYKVKVVLTDNHQDKTGTTKLAIQTGKTTQVEMDKIGLVKTSKEVAVDMPNQSLEVIKEVIITMMEMMANKATLTSNNNTAIHPSLKLTQAFSHH